METNRFCFQSSLRPISEVRTHKQAIKQTIYVCKTLLYEEEKEQKQKQKEFNRSRIEYQRNCAKK
jgi:hypothetical protein